MRHLRKGRKFGRVKNQRNALIRNLAFAFFKSGRIITSEAKAKELRPFVEKIITAARGKNINGGRDLAKILPARIIPKIMKETAPRYASRTGGYTRIIKLGSRKSDSSQQVILELV